MRELRKAAGLTQAELAAEAKTLSKVISRFETGERSINIATLIMAARIAKALGVHAEDLIDGQNLPDGAILAYGECPGYERDDCFEWRGPQAEKGEPHE